MTILAAVSSLVALNPVLYASVALLSSGCMIALTTYLGNAQLHMPFYINHIIFMVVVITVEIRNYRSIKEQYILNEKLEEWAEIDALTRVLNRRALDNYFEEIKDAEEGFSFVLLDADNFKTINDTYGHQAGVNYVLVEADRVGDGITKNTTAKITSQHGLIYQNLIKGFGKEAAVKYYEANERAIERYAGLCQEIDCNFERKASYVYSLYDSGSGALYWTLFLKFQGTICGDRL